MAVAEEGGQPDQRQYRADSGTRSVWRNPDSGNSGSVTPIKTYAQPSGTYCREFAQTITVGGNTEQAYGHACRMPDGTWKLDEG